MLLDDPGVDPQHLVSAWLDVIPPASIQRGRTPDGSGCCLDLTLRADSESSGFTTGPDDGYLIRGDLYPLQHRRSHSLPSFPLSWYYRDHHPPLHGNAHNHHKDHNHHDHIYDDHHRRPHHASTPTAGENALFAPDSQLCPSGGAWAVFRSLAGHHPRPQSKQSVEDKYADPAAGYSNLSSDQRLPQTGDGLRPGASSSASSSLLANSVSSNQIETQSYADAILSVPRKRSHHSSLGHAGTSASIITVSSDVRVKRRQLLRQNPSSHYATGPMLGPASRPLHVNVFLDRFWTANFEAHCVPWTADTEALIKQGYSLREFPAHSRMTDIPPTDCPRALELVQWAIDVHRGICECSTKVKDEASWYEYVKLLLSTIPSTDTSRIPSLPARAGPTRKELLVVVDATTKTTAKTILPAYPTVKLDFLLCFHPDHEAVQDLTEMIIQRNIAVNVFTDPAIAESIIPCGIEVKSCNGDGEATAEYQLSIWAAKTLELSRTLAGAEPGVTNADIAVGIAVRAHVWSLYVSFWDPAGAPGGKRKITTYGPVGVAGTDTLYGLFKVLRFIGELQRWAAEDALPDWRDRVLAAVDRLDVSTNAKSVL